MAQSRHRLADADGRQRGHLREVGADDGPRPNDVAAELYETRLRSGIELDYAAGELRIHYEQLVALEEGRFDDLPGPAYVIGFLRSYATYLGLDADEIVRRFKAETAYFDARQDLTFPSPHDEGRVPTGAIIVLGLVLVGAAYAGWYYVSNVDRVAVERIPEVPDRLDGEIPPESESLSIDGIVASIPEPLVIADAPPAQAAEDPGSASADTQPESEETQVQAIEPEPAEPAPVEPEPVESAQVETAASEPEVVQPDVAETVVAEPQQLETLQPEAQQPEAQQPEAQQPEAQQPEAQQPEAQQTASMVPEIPAPVVESTAYVPREFGLANSGSAIRLRARLESWVQVTGADNELLLTRILRPGDIYHVPDRPDLVLMTGNAGGLEVLVGTVVAPALGPVGKVQRRVALDPERLLAGTAID